MCFVGTNDRMVFWYRVRGGGCTKLYGLGVPHPHSSIFFIPLWLSAVNRPRRAEREKKRGTRATPPKVGGHVARWPLSLAPNDSRSVLAAPGC